MNILVISSYLPYPLHSGGDVRLYNLLLRLGKRHDVTLVCEMRPFQTKKDKESVEKICNEVFVVKRKKQWSLGNIIRTAFSSHSFLITGHTLPEMTELITALISEKSFDLIHVETSYVFQNLPHVSLPIVLAEHNIEYQVYEKYTDTSPFFLRPFLSLDVKKLRKEEEGFWRKADVVVTVSEKEKKVLDGVGIRSEIVPNGVDTKVFQLKKTEDIFEKKEKKVLFIGDYKWIQNQNTIRWILSEIWPEIEKNTEKDVKLWLIGRNMPQDIKNAATDRIIIEGVSQRPAHELFSEAFVLLSPLKVAGGTQYKILESLAVGTPVITTRLGVGGLKKESQESILLGDSPEEMAEQMKRLLGDEKLYKKIAEEGRVFIEKHYGFDAIAEKLIKVYDEVVKG
jgi:glycosyltransferase involved in cell wall biosynthesis